MLYLTLRKITINDRVRYISISEKKKKKENKPKTLKAGSLPRKQNKDISQNNKKFPKNVAASGFGKLLQNSICAIISIITHTILRVSILGYTCIYLSSCTYVLILCYVQLYEYLY